LSGLMESVFDVTPYFQDSGHDIRLPLAAAYVTASASCPLLCRACMTSLAHCIATVSDL